MTMQYSSAKKQENPFILLAWVFILLMESVKPTMVKVVIIAFL